VRELWVWIWKHSRGANTYSNSNLNRCCIWVTAFSLDNVFSTEDEKHAAISYIVKNRSPQNTTLENPLENDGNVEQYWTFDQLCALDNPLEELKRQGWHLTDKWDAQMQDKIQFVKKGSN